MRAGTVDVTYMRASVGGAQLVCSTRPTVTLGLLQSQAAQVHSRCPDIHREMEPLSDKLAALTVEEKKEEPEKLVSKFR